MNKFAITISILLSVTSLYSQNTHTSIFYCNITDSEPFGIGHNPITTGSNAVKIYYINDNKNNIYMDFMWDMQQVYCSGQMSNIKYSYLYGDIYTYAHEVFYFDWFYYDLRNNKQGFSKIRLLKIFADEDIRYQIAVMHQDDDSKKRISENKYNGSNVHEKLNIISVLWDEVLVDCGQLYSLQPITTNLYLLNPLVLTNSNLIHFERACIGVTSSDDDYEWLKDDQVILSDNTFEFGVGKNHDVIHYKSNGEFSTYKRVSPIIKKEIVLFEESYSYNTMNLLDENGEQVELQWGKDPYRGGEKLLLIYKNLIYKNCQYFFHFSKAASRK